LFLFGIDKADCGRIINFSDFMGSVLGTYGDPYALSDFSLFEVLEPDLS